MVDIASVVAALTAAVSLIATIAIHFHTVRNLKQKAANTDTWLERLENEISIVQKQMETKIQVIADQRNKDNLDFTEMLAALNNVITRLDITLQFVRDTLTKVDKTLEKHDRKIDELNGK